MSEHPLTGTADEPIRIVLPPPRRPRASGMRVGEPGVDTPAALPRARRLLIATLLRPEGPTGVQTHVQGVLAQAPRLAIRPELVTPFDAPPALYLPCFAPGRLIKPVSTSLYVWWYLSGHALVLHRQLRTRLRDRVPSVIYAQDPFSAKVACALRAAGHPIEVVLALHFNLSEAEEWAGRGFLAREGRVFAWIQRVEEEVIPTVDRLVAPSRYMLERVRERIPAAPAVPSACVPNFVVDRSSAQRSVAPDGDLVSIGTLEPRKNHAFLLDVLAACHAAGHHYRLAIMGEGPLRGALRARANALGIGSHVDLLGAVPQAGASIGRYRAYVHAASMENLPITLIEALAAGRPVFAAPSGGIPEIVTDGLEGRHWDLADAPAAARALIEVLENGERSAAVSAAARATYEARFAPERVLPMLLRAVLGSTVAESP